MASRLRVVVQIQLPLSNMNDAFADFVLLKGVDFDLIQALIKEECQNHSVSSGHGNLGPCTM